MNRRQPNKLAALLVCVGLSMAATGTASASDGIPANEGCGKLYGSLVSSGARGGGFGPETGPAAHQGLHGIKAALCGGG